MSRRAARAAKSTPASAPSPPLTLADVSIESGGTVLPGPQVAMLLEYAIARWKDYRKRIGEDAISGCFEYLGALDHIAAQLETVAESLGDIVGESLGNGSVTETAHVMEIVQRDAVARIAASTATPESYRVLVQHRHGAPSAAVRS